MSAPMVRAILDGRKTQTRRVVKVRDVTFGRSSEPFTGEHFGTDTPEEFCPYGKPGDLLWVRENFFQYGGPVEYAADDGVPSFKRKMTPCIHMPRWASRLTLRITDVRVERLQDISETDAKAEGVGQIGVETGGIREDSSPVEIGSYTAAYAELWDEINGRGAWHRNPWVWVVAFAVEHRNVDDVLRDARAAA